MRLSYIGLCLILAACWSFAVLPAKESDPADNLSEAKQLNLGGDLQKIMKEQKGLSRMYPLLFREDDTELEISELIKDLEPYRNKRIAKINFVSRDLFTAPSEAASSGLVSRVVKLGNTLHPKIQERLIREQLFFAEGDSLDPEYLLGNLQYLYDKSLFSELAFEIESTEDDEITIDIITREKFFLQFGATSISRDKYSFRIGNRNLFGTGYALENTLHADIQDLWPIGWESSLSNHNILGSFLQGNIHVTHVPGQKQFDCQIQRPFIFPVFDYSGGGDFSTSKVYPPQDSVSVTKTEAGAWLARNFDLFEFPRYAYAALSINQDWYELRPYSDAENGMPWQKSFFALGALAITQSSYRYLPRVSSVLDNDYLPVGYLFELYGGADLGEYINRPFTGVHGSFSIFPNHDQYIYIKSALEGFWSEEGVEEGVFALEPGYISQTLNLGDIKARTFINARYIRSRRMLQTQSLSLRSNPFYRGKKDLSGTNLFQLSLEEDLSLPISLLGFQVNTFAFADLAIMEDKRRDTDTKNSLFYQGIGIRLSNPSLIWDFFEFYFSVNQSPQSRPGLNVGLRLSSAIQLDGFKGRRPQRYELN